MIFFIFVIMLLSYLFIYLFSLNYQTFHIIIQNQPHVRIFSSVIKKTNEAGAGHCATSSILLQK